MAANVRFDFGVFREILVLAPKTVLGVDADVRLTQRVKFTSAPTPIEPALAFPGIDPLQVHLEWVMSAGMAAMLAELVRGWRPIFLFLQQPLKHPTYFC